MFLLLLSGFLDVLEFQPFFIVFCLSPVRDFGIGKAPTLVRVRLANEVPLSSSRTIG